MLLTFKIFIGILSFRFMNAIIIDSYYMPSRPKQQVDTFNPRKAQKAPTLRERSNEDNYDHYVKPLYKYGYSVFDPYTLDVKSQWEHRDGDSVRGAYNMLEADGSMRIVEYTSDKDTGFRAIVKKIPFYLDKSRRPVESFPTHTKSKIQHHELPEYEESPFFKPEAAAYKQEMPAAYKLETPAYKPETPVYQQQAPAYKQEAPAYKLETPVYKMETPFYKQPQGKYVSETSGNRYTQNYVQKEKQHKQYHNTVKSSTPLDMYRHLTPAL